MMITVVLREGKRGKGKNMIGGVHLAQRRGKRCESERKHGNKARKLIKGIGEET